MPQVCFCEHIPTKSACNFSSMEMKSLLPERCSLFAMRAMGRAARILSAPHSARRESPAATSWWRLSPRTPLHSNNTVYFCFLGSRAEVIPLKYVLLEEPGSDLLSLFNLWALNLRWYTEGFRTTHTIFTTGSHLPHKEPLRPQAVCTQKFRAVTTSRC